MTKYRILHVTPFFPPDKGGISIHVFNLRLKLCDFGNLVQVVAPKDLSTPDLEMGEEKVSRIKSIYLPGWPYPTLKSVSIPVDLGLGLRSIIRKGEFDIVHAHGHHYPVSWIAIKTAHKYNIPSILTLHGMYALNPYLLGGKSTIEDWFNKTIFSGMLSNTDALIGLTDQIVKYGRIHTKGSLSRYFTIANGVNTKVYKDNLKRKLEFRRKYKIDPDAVVILFCGRFEHVKGVLEFASAIVALVGTTKKKVEVVLVGDGTLKHEVQRILSGTPCIHILPWQPHDRIHEIYIASDIFVTPSKFEALPITAIEAMNALLHIVYTPVGGMNEILKPYSYKTILRTGTREEITKILSDILSRDFPANSDESSFIYAQSFDWGVIARSTQIVYDLLVR